MTATKKKKPMTAREKAERARIRKELRAEGVLPPVKKPLNRKKFCEEARNILEHTDLPDSAEFICYLIFSLGLMAEYKAAPGSSSLSKEAVGAAKAVLIARRMVEANREWIESGKPNLTIEEKWEMLRDIYEA